jgi:multiple sugar transport system ATP-binding protein
MAEDIDAGEVRIGGKDVSNKPPKDRDIAMVFQNYALYPHMTVADNMGFALKLKGVPKAKREEQVLEAAKLLDLEKYLDRKPKALSGGQRQRVAMGRAIVRSPAVFLMDEPLSNLDAKLRVETRANIAALQTRLGTTTLYVTHDQVEAMTMGHRVAVLRDGQLQQCASPRDLYENPINQFVAGFIGSPAMNLQTVPVADGGVRLGGTVLPLPPAVRAAAAKADLKKLTVGIRPEHMHLVATGGGVTAELRGEVMLVEELGADALLHVRLPEDEAPVVARTEGRRPPAQGQAVTLHVQTEDVFAFDPSSGARLAG